MRLPVLNNALQSCIKPPFKKGRTYIMPIIEIRAYATMSQALFVIESAIIIIQTVVSLSSIEMGVLAHIGDRRVHAIRFYPVL